MQPDNELEFQNRKKLCNAIASVIMRHRTLMEKSITKLSAEASVNKATWIYIEKSEIQAPSIVALWKMAEALDIKPEELIKEVHNELGEDFSLSGLN